MATAPLNLPWNDKEFQLDYLSRTDGQPVYQGFASSGTPTSEARWTLYKFTYNGSNFVTKREIFYKVAWDNRTNF